MIIEVEIKGARVIISGDNLSVHVSQDVPNHPTPAVKAAVPHSISDLIERWPTIAKFAYEVGCGYEAARQMRLRNSIGPGHWGRVIAAAQRKGFAEISFEWLAKHHASNSEAVA